MLSKWELVSILLTIAVVGWWVHGKMWDYQQKLKRQLGIPPQF